MTEAPSRDDVIELLNKLGSDRDEDVLEAAREVHARITAAGMTWEELLVSDGAGDTDDDDDIDDNDTDDTDDDDTDDTDDTDDDDTDDTDDTDDDDTDDNDDDDTDDIDDTGDDDTGDDDTGDDDSESPDPEDEAPRPAGKAGAKHADSMALIDELLAKSDISADMREELEGYKTDIVAGDFETRDRRYVSAVHKRLSKRR
jgi:hypothetical protein